MSEQGSYFSRRMEQMGVTPEINRVELWQNEKGNNVLKPFPIFTESPKGIDILVYDIDGMHVKYKNDGSRWKKDFKITRLETPVIDQHGNEKKYNIPKGAGTYPFFPPGLLKKYRDGVKIKTLVLTEGYFKAFTGETIGIDVVGLSSITHLKDKDTKKLHGDILKLCKRCMVENVIWLTDGDCLDISDSAYKEGKDLYKRPNGFFRSCIAVRDAFSQIADVGIYFKHVLSNFIPKNPKGLDDLILSIPKKERKEVRESLYDISGPNRYFHCINITFGFSSLRSYFHIHNVEDFIAFHAERGYKDLFEKPFVYNGTTFQWNPEESKCVIKIPQDAFDYIRVGDDYFEKIEVPDKHDIMEKLLHKRNKTTIIDDHGRKIIEHIPKYKAFCNIPDNINHQPVIHNCYNLYSPMEWDPEEGDIDATLSYLRHIFGTQDIKYTDDKTGEELVVNQLDIALDYFQLIYTQPWHFLPILCLVSKENNTGKSTLRKWLKEIYKNNCACVGNAELASDFNAFWAGKLLIICDEAKIDKHTIVEKIKNLSTNDKMPLQRKGKDHSEVTFFGKFILITNNEEDFIYASENDVRFWVIKVKPISKKNLNLNMVEEMMDEIPAFLHFLQNRKMATKRMYRHWFQTNLIETEALEKVRQHSMPQLQKDIVENIRDMFFTFGCDTIMMDRKTINEEFFRSKNNESYIGRICEERMKLDRYHVYMVNGIQYPSLKHIQDEIPDFQIETAKKVYKVKKYHYYKLETIKTSDSDDMQLKVVRKTGRPYIFKIEQFLTEDEIKLAKSSEYAHQVVEPYTPESTKPVQNGELTEEDLEFLG